jgi:6-phosphogluconolactonase (cycloisomerase 2 family)
MDDSRRSLVEFDGVLYTANWGSHDISALRIEADGALTPLPGSPFSSGAFTPGSLDVHPSLPLLYVTHDAQDTLVTLAIAPDGSLSEAFPPLPTGVNENGLTNLAVHPSGQVLWASSRPHSEGGDYYKALHAFGIGADGAPTDLGTFAPAKPYANLVCTPSGDQLYAVTTRGQTTPTQPMGVYGFDVSLTPAIEYPVIDGSPFFNTAESIDVTKDLVTSVDGRFLFVYNTANPFNPASFTHIHTYAVEESGALTSLGVTEETGVFPVRILSVSADGTRLFTVGTTTNVYEIDADGGLTYLGSSPSYGISLHATGAVAVL